MPVIEGEVKVVINNTDAELEVEKQGGVGGDGDGGGHRASSAADKWAFVF